MTDPIMNPPAPSGRRDDSSLTTTEHDRFALPKGTRVVVDAGGAKHYLPPDGGPSRYVPPGEVGNFYIEDEGPQDALRRHLVQELPYVDAAKVNTMVGDVFGALDELRKAGADLKLVPVNDDVMPGLKELLERAYNASDVQEWPKMFYHAEQGNRIVMNEKEAGDLGEGWHTNPEDAKAARSGPAAAGLPMSGVDEKTMSDEERKQAEEDAKKPLDPRIQDMDRTRIGDTGGVIKTDVAPADKPVAVI